MPPQLLRNGRIPGGRCIRNFKMHVGLNQDRLRKDASARDQCIASLDVFTAGTCWMSTHLTSLQVADGRLSSYIYPLWSLVLPYIVYSPCAILYT